MSNSLVRHLIYLHGFNSSPQSQKANELRQWLSGRDDLVLHAPQLSHSPARALQQARQLVDSLPVDSLLIGSSLGGFYAAWLANTMRRHAILINPVVTPHLELAQLPRQQFQPYTNTHYYLSERDYTVLKQHVATQPIPSLFWLITGSADEVLDWRIAVRHFKGSRLTIFNGDDHRLQRWPACLPALPVFAGWASSARAGDLSG